MKWRTYFLLLAVAMPVASHAGYVVGVTPGQVRVMGPTGSAALTPTNLAVIAGCSSSDFYVITAANNAKMMLGVVLAAKAMGKTVKLYVPDDPGQKCDSATGRPSVIDITLED